MLSPKNQRKEPLACALVASASEIATLSKIRREEIYRIIPKLEKHGIITTNNKSRELEIGPNDVEVV